MEFKEAVENLKKLLLRKNHDYGNSVGSSLMLVPDVDLDTALLVRMSDKLRRLDTVSTQGTEVPTESMADTYLDLAGYCVMGVVAEYNCEVSESITYVCSKLAGLAKDCEYSSREKLCDKMKFLANTIAGIRAKKCCDYKVLLLPMAVVAVYLYMGGKKEE